MIIATLIYLILAVGTFTYCLHLDADSFCEAYPTWRNKVAVIGVWLVLWWWLLGSALWRKARRGK